MKKLSLNILLLLTLVATKINAQVKNNLSFGPIIGFGHTTVSGEIDDDVKKKFNPAFNVGIRLTYSTNPHWAFGGDLSYRTEGAKLGSTTSNEETQLLSTYFRIDPKAYYFFGEPGQSFRPKISLGPSFGFLVGGKIKFYEGTNMLGEEKIGEYIKNSDFGLAGAVGFNYRIESGIWLNVDAAYTHGLMNIGKQTAEDAVCNRSLFLNLGVLFGIGNAKK